MSADIKADTKRLDPRIERTRKLLSETLINLLTEKQYAEITVQDVTERARLSRTTFYQHYKDVDDLLMNSLEQVYNSLATGWDMPSLEELRTKGYSETCFDPADFLHAAKYKDFYLAMFGEKGSPAFQRWLYGYYRNIMRLFFGSLLPDGHHTDVPMEIIIESTANIQLGLLRWWLENDMPYSAHQMARMAYAMSLGPLWGTGLGIAVPTSMREVIGDIGPHIEE
jgi:AcrR family transcriptional regulator